MHETSLHQAQELCSLLDSLLAQIRDDDQADEDVKIAAFDLQEDIRFFGEAVFWSELRRQGRNDRELGPEPQIVTLRSFIGLRPFRISPCMEQRAT